MSDISDELRKFTNTYHLNSLQIYELKRIADRIDAAHRSALEKLAAQLDETSDMREFCGRIEQAAANREDVTLWGVDYVALPVDADGVPIHVGDTVYLDDGRKAEVTHIDLMWGTSCIVCFASGKDHDCFPSGISHTRPDSWERIADELDEQAGSLTKDGYTWQEDAIHDFADRIRKLAKEGE